MPKKKEENTFQLLEVKCDVCNRVEKLFLAKGLITLLPKILAANGGMRTAHTGQRDPVGRRCDNDRCLCHRESFHLPCPAIALKGITLVPKCTN